MPTWFPERTSEVTRLIHREKHESPEQKRISYVIFDIHGDYHAIRDKTKIGRLKLFPNRFV